jgi:1-pyrroline-5-carboxylate dehydrogenase
MPNSIVHIPSPINEPVGPHAPGSEQWTQLRERCTQMLSEDIEVPLIIGGKEVRTGDFGTIRCPHDHSKILGRYHKAGAAEVDAAADAAAVAWRDWSELAWEHRAAIFLRAADLLTGSHRTALNASTMLGQSKTSHQAEIDAACEFIDFLRFNPAYMEDIYSDQPGSGPGMWNQVEYRALEGFVFAVTPFNFTSIAGNLCAAPAMMGNTVLWKPASSSVLSGWHIMELFRAAGVPDGVINFLPGSGATVGNPALARPDLAGIHFTGSTPVFQQMWKTVGANIADYRTYPRIVGETGGKDFVFVHASAEPGAVATNLLRGSFEYQGQKCSAASRAYIPQSLWPAIKAQLADEVAGLGVGDVLDNSNFMGAVIDEAAFRNITGYIDYAKASSEATVVVGGDYDDSVGWFVRPTVIQTTNPHFKLMEEEIFGPVLTVYVYPDAEFEETLAICDRTSPYALTGAVFSQDRYALQTAMTALRHAAGNFYINDKPTGAVVGQQPFGGSRASGTNDKAGSKANLMRWTSVRTIKETFSPATDYRYPFLKG